MQEIPRITGNLGEYFQIVTEFDPPADNMADPDIFFADTNMSIMA